MSASTVHGKPVAARAARTRWLLEAPIAPTLLRLAAPNVLNLLAITGMIMFDGLFVGRLGADALAGVSLAFPWVMLMQHGAASGMGGAVSSAVARALGGGSQARADALATHALWLALGAAALFSTLMLLGGPLLYRSLGGTGEVLDAAIAYSNVAFGGIASIWLLNLLGNVVRGTGDMMRPASVLLACVLVHIAISPVLIFGLGPLPGLGPAGAGWGLITAFGAGSVVLARHLRSGRALVTLRLRPVRLQASLFGEFFRVGVPGMLNVAVTNLTVIVLTALAARLGRDVAIGYAMGARLEYIVIPLAFGFGTAIVAMVGTNWGAGQHERARAVAWTGAFIVAAACGAIGLFFAGFPELWIGLFSPDAAVVSAGTSYLRIVGPAYALYGFGLASYFACQGVGEMIPAVAANALRLLVAVAGGALALHAGGPAGATGLFAAIALAFLVYAVLMALALSRFRAPGSVAQGGVAKVPS